MRFAESATILFQGDSITDTGRARDQQGNANAAAALGLGYAHFIGAALLADYPGAKLRVFNRGISGNRIVDIFARWREDAINLQPALISILIGVNDTWHGFMYNGGVAVPKFERMYRMLLSETHEALPQTKLVLCEPFVLPCGVVKPEWVAEMKQRQKVVAKLAKEYKAVFVGFQGMFDRAMKEAPAEYWAADGVHPTPAGHMRMARTWLEKVVG